MFADIETSNFTIVLLLCAVFRDWYLRPLVNAERLRHVLDRTVNFLERLATISPTIRRNHETLEKLQRILFDAVPWK